MTKSKKKNGVFSAIVTVFLLIVTLVCLILVVKTVMGKDASIFGFRWFYILTDSMEPSISQGATVFVVAQDGYSKDDVITFKSTNPEIEGEANTHRISEVVYEDGTRYYITKGDNNNAPDSEKVYDKQVYGKVIFSTGKAEWVGNVVEFLMTPVGFFAAIIVPVLLAAVLFMKEYVKTYALAVKEVAKKKAIQELGITEEQYDALMAEKQKKSNENSDSGQKNPVNQENNEVESKTGADDDGH